MKKFSIMLMVCLSVIGFVFGVHPGQAEADDFLGDFCWDFSSSVDEDPVTATVKLGVRHMGGAHYLASGIITVTSPLVFQMPAFGNVEFVGDKIHVTLSYQGRRYENEESFTVGTDMTTIILDPATLNGTTRGIGIYYDGAELSEGTVTFRSCQ